MRISDWSSDVCSSDLGGDQLDHRLFPRHRRARLGAGPSRRRADGAGLCLGRGDAGRRLAQRQPFLAAQPPLSPAKLSSSIFELAGTSSLPELNSIVPRGPSVRCRSEEHTSELQSLMRTSYAVFCLKKKKQS